MKKYLLAIFRWLERWFEILSEPHAPPPKENPDKSHPEWLKIAEGELGVSERRGGENPRIIEYHKYTSLKASEDEVAWCSSFVNFCMAKAGIRGTNSAMALSWKNWGEGLKEPRPGCVVVFDWKRNGHGHVTFFDKWDGSSLRCIGGNQGDSVRYSNYATGFVVGYRWPPS